MHLPRQHFLVGGLEHEFHVSIYWENSSQLTFIFFKGVGPTTNQFSSSHNRQQTPGLEVLQRR